MDKTSELNSTLKSFKAKQLIDIEGNSYRLLLHAWHQTPGAIMVNCEDQKCYLEIRYTDGYGTYNQGKLVGKKKQEISQTEFDKVGKAFARSNFDKIDSRFDSSGIYPAQKDDHPDEIRLCLHAPHYFLEYSNKNNYHAIYRYCDPDYRTDLEIAFPLIELAEKYFPEKMKQITSVWIQEERENTSVK